MPAVVHWHSSEEMSEVADCSAKLMIGASVYLGPEARWPAYEALYHRVYVHHGLRVLRPDGFLVVLQTDQYRDGVVVPRNALLTNYLGAHGFELFDVKIWKRKKADFFQPPFSQVLVWRPAGGTARRPKKGPYLEGIWDYPQLKGGPLGAYPDALCHLLVDTFTAPGDLIVDPFAGTARLLGIAAAGGRDAIGYEINPELRETVDQNLSGFLQGGTTC